MGVAGAIQNTIKRLSQVSRLLDGESWNALLRGFGIEYDRTDEKRRLMQLSSIPNNMLPVEAFDDYEKMYGIKKYDGFTDQERRNVIIERMRQFYTATIDDINDAIKSAGFTFYCIANHAKTERETQYNREQYGFGVQYMNMPRRINPSTVPGILISGSNFEGGGREITENAQYWGFVLFLSPFQNRLATESELTPLYPEQIEYLDKLLSSIKYARDWFILQAREIVR